LRISSRSGSARSCTGGLPSRFLSRRLVLAIHRDQIEALGGRPGIRDEGLLESALEQPRAMFAGELLHPTTEAQAAAYLFHLISNHPFVDGNKRVAFAAMDTFLRLNRRRLDCSDADAYELVMAVARSERTKDDIASFLRGMLSER
jgi:death-on-curing protein